MVPSSIGPYRIIEGLGSGANGEVYLAEDTRLGRKVAVKTLSALDSKELTEAKRWVLREARAAARLNHPNIASVYDVLESPEGAHIVMEYVCGETLAQRLRDGPLPPAQVLEIAVQLADALAEAHSLGVVHRDLKPGNVIITPKGSVKVLDFGLAQVRAVEPGSTPVRSSRDFTLDGRQIGTPPYMPPEHLMGDPVDVRGDIYSLGVMLFELLTGHRPFQGPDAMALTMAILTQPTPRAGSGNAAVPPALDAIVFRAMSRLPQDRYASAAEMADDLRRATAGPAPSPVVSGRDAVLHAPTVSRDGRRPLPVGRRRRVFSIAGLIVLVGLGVYSAVARGRPPASSASATGPPVVAVLPLATVAGDTQGESLATGIADSLISSLTRVRGLTVISRQATLTYRDRKQDPAAIARELGVTVMVDGALQRSGDRVRVTLSILRPGSKIVSWSNSYDGSLTDLLKLQTEVGEAVVDAFSLALTSEDHQLLQQPPTRNIDALADYSQARTFLDRPDVKDNLDHSIALFLDAVAKDPRFVAAHAGLGAAYWRRYLATHDIVWSDKARDAISEALRLDPSNAAARSSFAVILSDTGRKTEAIEELRKAIAAQPSADEAHQMLGRLLFEAGDQEEGLAELRKAISLRPQYWSHHHNLGMALYKAGRFQEALLPFRRATELQPDQAWSYQMLGTTYHALGQPEQAVSNYLRAIQLGHSKAYSNLGTLYFEQSRFGEAAHAFEEALKIDPRSPVAHRNLGDVYAHLGQQVKARKYYEMAAQLTSDQLKINPRDARTLAMLAVYEAKIGNRRAAGQHISEALAVSPTSGEVLYRKAIVVALAGDGDAAVAALEAALERGYSASFASKDEDLALIRSRPEYRRIMAAAR